MFDKATRPQFLEKSTWLFSLIGVAFLASDTAGSVWCLSSNLSLSVRLSIQDDAMDVARSLPCGRYLLALLTGNKEGSKELMVLRIRSKHTRFLINIVYIPIKKASL